MTGQKKSILISFMIGFVTLVGLNQWIKGLVVAHLKGHKPFVVWDGVFESYYSENRGAVFDMMQEKQLSFFLIILLVLGAVAYLMVKMSTDRKYRPMSVYLMMISAGAVGSMIDWISQSYVVDSLHFKLVNSSTFNVTDCYITIAVACLVILIMFYYKDEDMAYFAVKEHGNAGKEQVI